MTTHASVEDWCELHQEASGLSMCAPMCLHWLPVGSTGILNPLLLMPQPHWPPWSAGSEAGSEEESTRAQAEKAPAGSLSKLPLVCAGGPSVMPSLSPRWVSAKNVPSPS